LAPLIALASGPVPRPPIDRPGATRAATATAPAILRMPLVALRADLTTGACGWLPTQPPPRAAPSRETARGYLSQARLVSYFPANAAWSNMWLRWDAARIDADFAHIAALGANAVRLVVPTDAFGYPTPSPAALDELSRTVDLAAAHRLAVHLTLFDGWSSYCDLAGSQEWASALLGPYRGDTRVAAVELQNEMDPADQEAVAWAQRMVPWGQELLRGTPITISVSGSVGVPGLVLLAADGIPLDYYDLHYYGPAPHAYAVLRRARDLVGPAPLFIGETGRSSYPSDEPGATTDGEEALQDQYLRTVERAAQSLEIPLAAPWIFSDLAPGAIPPGEWASKLSQYRYGLLRIDGTPKPAALSIARLFTQGTVDLSFNNGFEDVGAASLPANWGVWRPADGRFARDTAVAHGGVASARIDRSGGDADSVPAFYLSPITLIVPGEAYTANAWAKAAGATGSNRLALAWFDASGAYLSTSHSPSLPPGETGWTRLSVTARAPSDAAFVEIHLQSAANQGTVWFDDVAFG
jgi:hypothetical protein